MMRRVLIALAMVVSVAGSASAEPVSQDTMRYAQMAANLDKHRDEVEKQLAAEQVKAYLLEQRIAALEKEVADLKKSAEKKSKGEGE